MRADMGYEVGDGMGHDRERRERLRQDVPHSPVSRYLLQGALTLTVLASLTGLSGCATMQQPDPLEAMNRKVFAFNEGLDKAVVKPVATAYEGDVPAPIRKAVGNFFGNIDDGWSSINALLQGRTGDSFEDLKRFASNSTLGVLGLADVATDLGLHKHPADLGQTLGRWGLDSGAYIVWPLFGPSTLRDSAGLPLEIATPALLTHSAAGAGALSLAHEVDARGSLLGVSRLIDDVALDKYLFVRDAYLERRRSLVCDCDPLPLDTLSDDAIPAPAAPAPPAPRGGAPDAPATSAPIGEPGNAGSLAPS